MKWPLVFVASVLAASGGGPSAVFDATAAGLSTESDPAGERPSTVSDPSSAGPSTASDTVGERPAWLQYGDVVLDPDPRGRVVAAAIRFPAGTASDPRGLEGTAYLLGRLLQEEVNRRIAMHAAAAEVEVSRDETVVTLVASPDGWSEALRDLEDVLYDAALPGSLFVPVQEELLEILTFESGAPVRAFELERTSFLRGPGDPGSRPPRGEVTTVELLQLQDLEDFRERYLIEEEAILAVMGPVGAGELEAALATPVRVLPADGDSSAAGSDAAAAPVSAAAAGAPAAPTSTEVLPQTRLRLHRSDAPLELPATPTGAPAWTVGQRTVIDRQLTSTWISVSFPFPPGTPDLLLDFVGHLVLEGLTPSPPDPGLYSAEVSMTRLNGSPVLIVSASVDPGITARWEDRLTTSLDSIAAQPPQGSFFALARRRFRSQLLLDLAVPENRAMWLVREIAEDPGAVSDPEADVWRIRREAVARAAAAAGPPRTILYGPVQMMDR